MPRVLAFWAFSVTTSDACTTYVLWQDINLATLIARRLRKTLAERGGCESASKSHSYIGGIINVNHGQDVSWRDREIASVITHSSNIIAQVS
jgi:hypothetical protein